MKNLIVVMLVYCVGIGVLPGSTPGKAEVIDKIVALLDEELILLSEIRENTEKPAGRILANLDNSTNIDRDALQYVIERLLLLREIQYLAVPKEREIVRDLAAQYIINTYHNQNAREFKQQLEERGITQAELDQELMLYMKGVDYIRRKFRFNVDINDSEVVLNLFQKWVEDLKAKARIQTSF